MKIYQWLNSCVTIFSKHLKLDLNNSYFEAYCLLEKALNQTKSELICNLQSELSENQLKILNSYISRRLNYEPLQYILEEWQFLDLKIKLGPGVLIPRPETEEWVSNFLFPYLEKKFKYKHFVLADICTGSGVIGLSVLKKFSNCKVLLIDISMQALKYCKSNLEINLNFHISNNKKNTNNQVEKQFFTQTKYHVYPQANYLLVNSDLTSSIKSNCLDIVVSNPPYVKSSNLSLLQPEIVNYEPHIALDGGEDGMKYIKQILLDIPRVLKKGGMFFCEHSYDHVENLFSITPSELKIVSTYFDYTNKPICTAWEFLDKI